MILEVCIDSVESALAAQEGGAGRVELCANLDVGGTTPDEDMVRSVRGKISIPLHMMIRPRGGDFCYSDGEFETMHHETETAKTLGVDGVVFGILDSGGNIDVGRSGQLLELARPMSVTFHRAFDECSDLFRGMDDLRTLGIDRVLTSGGKGEILDNARLMRDLASRSNGTVKIMAGGGVNFENISDLLRLAGVDEVHTLSAVLGQGVKVVDADKVRKMVRLLDDVSLDSQV